MSQLSKYLSLVIVALLFQSKGFCKNIDSLKIALKNAKHDTTRCNIYYNLGKGLYIEQPDSAILFWGKVKEISENKLKESDILKKWYLKKLGKAFNGLGTVYQNLGDIAKSLDYYHKSLKACEQNQDKEGASTALNSIGGTYYNQGDLSNALEYWNRSLALYLEIGERSGIAMALTNIGVVYKRQNNISKALTYYKQSLKIQEQIGNKSGIAYSLNNIGAIFANESENDSAMNYFNKSSKIFEEIGNEKAIVLIYINIGEVYLKQGKLKEAFFCATKSRAIAEKLGFPSEMGSSASLLKTIFIKQNKYKEAFEMYEVEIKMRDSINNQETQKATIKKQMQYTYEKKELETKAEQDKKDAVSKAELKQKENERNYFIVGFGLVAVLALFILRGYKQKQKANEIIAAQKDLVDEKQKEILDSIYYAKRIQTALLPSEKYIDKSLKQLRIS